MKYLERARALATSSNAWVAPEPRPASTVVLLRDGDEGIETFLLQRSMTMRFAPGVVVFPGGRMDDADAGSFVACGVRETREETTVSLAEDALVPWSRWITPEVEDRRYDVHFFCAALPKDAKAVNVTSEADVAMWLPLTEIMKRFYDDRIAMLQPTISTIRELVVFDDVASALASPREITPLLPRGFLAEDGKSVTWAIVNADTDEIIRPMHGEPKGWETEGTASLGITKS